MQHDDDFSLDWFQPDCFFASEFLQASEAIVERSPRPAIVVVVQQPTVRREHVSLNPPFAVDQFIAPKLIAPHRLQNSIGGRGSDRQEFRNLFTECGAQASGCPTNARQPNRLPRVTH
jgi:hypothetical protein